VPGHALRHLDPPVLARHNVLYVWLMLGPPSLHTVQLHAGCRNRLYKSYEGSLLPFSKKYTLVCTNT
jgi:hypothetical protein